ncbi:MAG: oligosaccharyl transferase, archaeosortase A system-associated, partial [Methanomicrobiales archaeon]
MFFPEFKRYHSLFIVLILVGFMVFTLWIRSLTALSIDLPHYLTFGSPDIWYNFRQIELMVHNYPVYNWFDPMTAYPSGKSIDWGPFLPFVTATLAILTGMTSRTDMMYLASWVIPVFAAMMVPVTYFIGKILWDWKIGIIASGLLAVTSGTYFQMSTFGQVDHHILEVLFGTLFCLMYMVTLKYCKQHPPCFTFQRIPLVFLGLSLLTALTYFAGFLNMPTMILFGLIVALYTFFQFIRNRAANIPDTSLLLTNIVVFSLLLVFMAIFGIQRAGSSLQQYSIAPIFAIVFIIVGTLVMYALSKWLNRNTGIYILVVIGIGAVIVLSILTISNGASYKQIMFFGQNEEISVIAESQPWSLDLAFSSFNVMVILSISGFVFLMYHIYTKKREEHLFFMIWSLIIFILTIQYIRFEYYFAVNITLLSSLCIGTCLTTGFTNVCSIKNRLQEQGPDVNEAKYEIPVLKKQLINPGNASKKVKVSATSKKLKDTKILGALIIVVILGATIISVGLSITWDMDYSASHDNTISNSWIETAEWLGAHTPDPGIDYLGVYQENKFVYPKTAYGILSWWDYGNYITFIGKRIPVANPFQDRVLGPNGAAAFYMSSSETEATRILHFRGARYVITDTPIATDYFFNLVVLNESRADFPLYMKIFFSTVPEKPGQLMRLNAKFAPYFHTTVARLQNFDGSMQIPSTITYLEYHSENRNGLSSPTVTYARLLNVTDASNAIKKFGQQPQGNSEAILAGQFLKPFERVPALQHFR